MRATMVGTEVISDAVRLACRAPSLHNSQPWSLAIEGDTVSIFADADRVVRAADSSGREALLACGALLDHFRVAVAAAGITGEFEGAGAAGATEVAGAGMAGARCAASASRLDSSSSNCRNVTRTPNNFSMAVEACVNSNESSPISRNGAEAIN